MFVTKAFFFKEAVFVSVFI